MARKRQGNTLVTTQWRGLQVLAALVAGFALGVLVAQSNALREQAKQVAARAKADRGSAEEPLASEPAAAPREAGGATSSIEADQWLPAAGSDECPPDYPIKGNATSLIYHLPGSASYNLTIPNICFATEEAAEAAGFRPPKR
ncbi:MAG: hypothetical protein ACJ789_08890 [Thermomicrobiales bacterium]